MSTEQLEVTHWTPGQDEEETKVLTRDGILDLFNVMPWWKEGSFLHFPVGEDRVFQIISDNAGGLIMDVTNTKTFEYLQQHDNPDTVRDTMLAVFGQDHLDPQIERGFTPMGNLVTRQPTPWWKTIAFIIGVCLVAAVIIWFVA